MYLIVKIAEAKINSPLEPEQGVSLFISKSNNSRFTCLVEYYFCLCCMYVVCMYVNLATDFYIYEVEAYALRCHYYNSSNHQ